MSFRAKSNNTDGFGWIETGSITFAVITIVLLCLFIVCLMPPASAWITGYNYRTGHYINGSNSGAQTNYQVMINVSNTSGTSSGNLFYIGGHCLNFPNDLRFTSTSDTQWDYWIESNNTTYATVWVEVPSIPNGSTNQIELFSYYGNSTATSASNGTNTFIQYHGSAIVGFHDPNISPVTNISYRGKVKVTTGGNPVWGIDKSSSSLSDSLLVQSDTITNNRWGYLSNNDVYTPIFESPSFSVGTYYFLDIYLIPTSIHFFVNNDEIASGITSMGNAPNEAMGLLLLAPIGDALQDWSFIKTYVSPEPTHSTYLTEEAALCTADFTGTPLSGGVPLSVQFTDTSTTTLGSLSSWYWIFGDSTPDSTLQNPAHVYTTTGTYDVKMKVTNSLGSTDWENKTAYIVAGNATTPTPTATPTPNFTYLTPTPTPTPAPGSEFFAGNISLSFEDANPAGPSRLIVYNDTGYYVGIYDSIDTIDNLVNGSYQIALQPSKMDYLTNPTNGLDAVTDFLKGNLVAIVLLCLVIGIIAIRRRK